MKRIKISNINTKELLKGSVIALFFKAFGILISFLFTLLIARIYGAEPLGVFVSFWSVLMVLSVIAKLGFDTSVVKFIAGFNKKNEFDNIKTIYSKAFKSISLISLLIAVILIGFSKSLSVLFYDTPDNYLIIIILAVSLIFYSLLGLNAESLKALKKITAFSLFQNGSIFLLGLLILLFLFPNSKSGIYIIYGVSISILILLPASSFIVYKSINPKTKIQNLVFPYSNREIFNISLPMLLGNSMLLLMNWTDSIMLSAMGPIRDVGIYNTAVRISALIPAILVAVNSIAMPKFAELKDNNYEFKKFVKQSTLLVSFLSLPIILGILIFPEFLLSLFGEEFIEGKSALVILGIGYFFSAISGSTYHILNMTGEEIKARNILVISAAVNIILNLILIPVYGIIGAAVASTFTNFLWNIAAVYFIYKKHGFLTYPIGLKWK